MNFGRKRRVVEATDHPVHLVLAFRPYLELGEQFGPVHRLPIIMKDGRSVQWLGENLAAVVA